MSNAQYLASLVNSSGNINIPVSNAGINFNNSSAIGASTLTDYETGTWTPVIGPQSGTLTAYTSNGAYVKIGKLVYLIGSFTITTSGTASGSAQMSGLPFQSSSSPSVQGEGIVRESVNTGVVYQITNFGNSSTAQVASLTNGAIVWTATYSYAFTLTYQATF